MVISARFIVSQLNHQDQIIPTKRPFLSWVFDEICQILSLGLLFGVTPSFSESICVINYGT